MREHVRELINNVRQRETAALGAEAVRLARIAAAIHAAQEVQQATGHIQQELTVVVQEQSL